MRRTSLELPASAARAWRVLTDTEAWPRWGPSARAVESPRRFVGAGLRGRVQTAVDLWLPFEITYWQAGRACGWRVGGVPATGRLVEPRGRDRCRVTFAVPA